MDISPFVLTFSHQIYSPLYRYLSVDLLNIQQWTIKALSPYKKHSKHYDTTDKEMMNMNTRFYIFHFCLFSRAGRKRWQQGFFFVLIISLFSEEVTRQTSSWLQSILVLDFCFSWEEKLYLIYLILYYIVSSTYLPYYIESLNDLFTSYYILCYIWSL